MFGGLRWWLHICGGWVWRIWRMGMEACVRTMCASRDVLVKHVQLQLICNHPLAVAGLKAGSFQSIQNRSNQSLLDSCVCGRMHVLLWASEPRWVCMCRSSKEDHQDRMGLMGSACRAKQTDASGSMCEDTTKVLSCDGAEGCGMRLINTVDCMLDD